MNLRFITNIVYWRTISPYFSAGLHANLYLYHQIYIDGSKSANNNWNRIFLLAGSFRHRLPNLLEHRNRLKILANYTVYDFEEKLTEIRSYIHRKLIYSDTLDIRLSKGMNFVTVYQLEKEDNGTFFKNLFAQQIGRKNDQPFLGFNFGVSSNEGNKIHAGK